MSDVSLLCVHERTIMRRRDRFANGAYIHQPCAKIMIFAQTRPCFISDVRVGATGRQAPAFGHRSVSVCNFIRGLGLGRVRPATPKTTHPRPPATALEGTMPFIL
jgi:hypothetical protein